MSASMHALFMPATGSGTAISGVAATGTGTSNAIGFVGHESTGPNSQSVPFTPLQKTLIAVLSATMISGTTLNEHARESRIAGTGTAPVVAVIPTQETRRQAARTTASLLSEIKGIFGFSVTQLASVLQVTRQIVYKWLDEQNMLVLQAKNRDRMQQMLSFASEWRTHSQRPIGKHAESIALAGGNTLLQMLSADSIDESQVREAMTQLATEVNSQAAARARAYVDKNVVSEALTAHSRTVGTVSEQDT